MTQTEHLTAMIHIQWIMTTTVGMTFTKMLVEQIRHLIQAIPSDNDADTVKLAHTWCTRLRAVNLCDAVDPDDDNDGHLDGESSSLVDNTVSFTSLSIKHYTTCW